MSFLSTIVAAIKLPITMASMDTDVTVEDEDFDRIIKDAYKNASPEEKKDAALLSLVADKTRKTGEALETKHSNSVKLDFTDNNEFRNDETVSRVNATEKISTPASELEDIPREKGGRTRDSRDK